MLLTRPATQRSWPSTRLVASLLLAVPTAPRRRTVPSAPTRTYTVVLAHAQRKRDRRLLHRLLGLALGNPLAKDMIEATA